MPPTPQRREPALHVLSQHCPLAPHDCSAAQWLVVSQRLQPVKKPGMHNCTSLLTHCWEPNWHSPVQVTQLPLWHVDGETHSLPLTHAVQPCPSVTHVWTISPSHRV